MKKLNELDYKNSVILLKAITDISSDLYKSNTTNILNSIVRNGNYTSEYGQFYKKVNSRKTINEVIKQKQQQILKLRNEVETLKLENPDDIYTEEKIVLNSKHTDKANEIAKELLKDIIENINNKTISNKYAKL